MNIIDMFSIPAKGITEFCNKHYIRKLAVFGSALRRESKEDSDIDILVEFHQEHIPGLFELVDMEEKLSVLFDGRKIDLRTPNDLSRYFRNEVINNADVLHVKDPKAE